MSTTTTIEPSPSSTLAKLLIAMGDIKLAHSVFAMPFAILGAFLVAPRTGEGPAQPIDWTTMGKMLVLVVVCMVFARNWAMLFNRVADAKVDADNPRTARRAFASGALKARDGYMLLGINAVAFMIACSLFGFLFANWWPTILGIPVLIWIAFYSLTKRFTWLCHIFLGGALAASPIAAAIAVGPELLMHTPAIFWIAGMVLCWVAGFDIIYALQDLDYDRSVGLNSMPAKFGWRGALWISRLLHIGAVACLLIALRSSEALGTAFTIAIVLTSGLLIAEHALLIRRGKAGIPMAFFTLNGVVSIVLGLAGCIDILLR
ncbi:MAG: UbiA-like polyprenyltransferase [Phycisphaerales bacterium JB052]